MTYTLHVPGRLPDFNELVGAAKGYGGKGFGYAKLKRQWTDTIALLAKAAKIPHLERVSIEFRWQEANRRRDPDNVAAGGRKLILDGLVVAGVLENDGWGQIAGWRDSFTAGVAGGVTVVLESCS